MGNPETHTRHWTKTNKTNKNTNNTTQKNNKMSNTDHTTKPTAIPRTREGYSVPASYKTPAMLLIYSRRVRHNYRQTTSIKHEPSNKQLCVKTKLTSFSCGNRSGHHNYERRDIQYDKMNNKPMNQSKMARFRGVVSVAHFIIFLCCVVCVFVCFVCLRPVSCVRLWIAHS
jgi:hypothetical protein